MPGETKSDQGGGRSLFERFLGIFAEVRHGEGVTAVLMFFNIFLILAAYYILKTVREALTIGGVRIGGIEGDEAKTYLSVIMAVLLLGIVPLYGALGSRMTRLRLLWTTTIFIIICLFGFLAWGLASGVGTAIGVSFFVWLGIVNYFLVAQFWSYANDIYSEEQGKRLFAIVAIGQSLGAVLGPMVAAWGSEYAFLLLGLAALMFAVCIVLYTAVDRREERADSEKRAAAQTPLSREGGFELVFKTRYLLLIALTILVTNLVNTTGEYILSNAALRYAAAEVPASAVVPPAAAGTAAPVVDEAALTPDQQRDLREKRSAEIGRFYGRFFSVVNLVGVLIQMLLVSRIFKYLGVRFALFVLPIIAFGGYAAIGLIGGLLIVRAVKTAENATDYSLQNTVKQALYLPTSREAKYKAKAAIDVFFVRFGDAGSAALVAMGLHVLAFGAREFAFVNVALCAVWILISVGIAREHRRITADKA